jgi:membrane-associated PAP2 superfamily phosphatase
MGGAPVARDFHALGSRRAGNVSDGVLFSFAQEARGAHFLSHDLASAALVWAIQLGLYAVMYRRSAAPAGTASATG